MIGKMMRTMHVVTINKTEENNTTGTSEVTQPPEFRLNLVEFLNLSGGNQGRKGTITIN